jgi:hypothetical protein
MNPRQQQQKKQNQVSELELGVQRLFELEQREFEALEAAKEGGEVFLCPRLTRMTSTLLLVAS